MTSAQVVETSVNVISNSPSQDYTHPDDRTLLYDILLLVDEQKELMIMRDLLFSSTNMAAAI